MVYVYNPQNGPVHHGKHFKIDARSYLAVTEETAAWLVETCRTIKVEGVHDDFPPLFIKYNAEGYQTRYN